MKIIRSYVLKDFFSAFSFSLLSLTLVMILGNLIKISDMVIRKGVAITDALKLFCFFVPYILGFTIPLSLLMGTLLSMGRLIADNEIVALNAAGISVIRILRIFLIVAVISILSLFILNDKIVPYFHYHYRSHIKNMFTKNISAIIEPGVYLDNFENTILYVSDINENKLKDIFVYEINNDKLSRLTYAKKGEFVIDDTILKLKLENGFKDEINSQGSKEFYRLNFKVFFVDIPMETRQHVEVQKKPSDMSIAELKEKISYLRNLNINPLTFVTELHKRINLALSPLSFVLLGFGVSLIVRHREKSINFGIAVVIAGTYYLLLLLGETLVNFEYITPIIGMSLANIVVILGGSWCIIRNVYIR